MPGKKKKRPQRQPKLTYKPLAEPRSIRLLHIEPADRHGTPLRANLLHTSLASNEYEALSYAWGDSVLDRHLSVSGCLLKITKSLDLALRAFRHTTGVRVIWVDAICINQRNEQEKGKQVAIMGDIYQAATRVLVWLGPGTPRTTEAMQFLLDLSSQSTAFGVPDEVGKGRIDSKIPMASISGPEADRVVAKAYATETDSLLGMSWFSRLWVVQELCLAKEVIVHCGPDSLAWLDFARGVETLTASIYKASYCQTGFPYKAMLTKIAEPRHLVYGRDVIVIMRNTVLRYNDHVPKMVASSQMSSRLCKDDRDRVYGMLALVKSDSPIVPDYSKTIAQVYTEFATLTSPQSSLFNAGLSYRGVSSLAKQTSDPNYMPSWVPDLRPSKSQWRPVFNEGYATSKPLCRLHTVDPRYPKMLSITGAHFDIINKQYGTKTPPQDDCRIDYLKVVSIMKTLIAECSIQRGDESNADFSGELFLTLAIEHLDHKESALFSSVRQFLDGRELLDKSWIFEVWRVYARLCLDSDGEVFRNAVTGGSVRTLSREGTLGLRVHSYLCRLFSQHNVFISTRGYLGLSPRDAKPGDVIAVFNGCSNPFVIRDAGKVVYGTEVVSNAFYVVAPCYLYGIMNQEMYNHQHDGEFDDLHWMAHPVHPFRILADEILLV